MRAYLNRYSRRAASLLSSAVLASALLLGTLVDASAQRSAAPLVRLRYATFDPLRGTPPVAEPLRLVPGQMDEVGLWLLQFQGPVRAEWVTTLKAQGIVFESYVPDYTFVVRMSLRQGAALPRRFSFVRWTGVFHPAYKIDPSVLSLKDPVRLAASAVNENAAQGLAKRLERYGAGVAGVDGAAVEVTGAAQMAMQLARTPEVRWVEARHADRLLNDRAAEVIGVGGARGLRVRGLYGAGQIVGIADSGLDTGNPDNLNNDFAGRLLAGFSLVRANDWSDLNGHGTHVAGSVLGSGVNSGSSPATHNYDGSFAGMAPEASLVFQSMGLDSSASLITPYDPGDLLRQAYPLGVRVHSNSWGSGDDRYGERTRLLDDFIYQNPDMVVLFAAGNSGADSNQDGVIDARSLLNLAVAKNVITVGASENNRPPDLTRYPLTDPRNMTYRGYGYSWDPFAGDYISDNTGGMAAFSSRGPTADGRIKPDIVAPGTNVVSVWSRAAAQRGLAADGPWAGAYSDANPMSKYCFSGGTSMATPIVAGACALVREFFEKGYYVGRRFSPSAALVKAILINGATDMDPGQYGTDVTREITARPNSVEGWGRLDLTSSLYPTAPRELFVLDNLPALATGEYHRLAYRVKGSSVPLKISVVWTDAPGSPYGVGPALVNDLDLVITTPSGQVIHGNYNTEGGDRLNNVECVDIANPALGDYEIRVNAVNVPVDKQSYALVVTGHGSPAGGRFPDVVPPSLSFEQPVDGATVIGNTRIEIKAVDDRPRGMDRVTLMIDDRILVGTRYAPPYVFYVNMAGFKPGVHTLKAEAYDLGRNRAQAQVNVTVKAR